MKVAISIPDELFRKADAESKRLKVSRSRFYAHAITAYLESHQNRAIIAQLNEVYGESPAHVGPGLRRAQKKSLDRTGW